MANIALCPHCGFDFDADAPIEKDGFVFDLAQASITFNGNQVPGSRQHRALLFALAKANGAAMSIDGVLNRISDSDDQKLVSVIVCKIRSAFKSAGIPCPIQTARGTLRWQMPTQAENTLDHITQLNSFNHGESV